MASSDEQSDKDCPLCMEALEIDDLNFYPCECKYQICRFCWHRIRTDENGLCPACRQQYPEDPVNFKPLTAEELQRIKSEKRKKEQKEKQKVSESRKHLANLRVIQDNLVYVIGLSARIADAEVLKKTEYFGKYGKIVKVVVSTSVGGQQQTTSNTAYVTYVRAEDALRAIQAVNNCQVDGRTVRASLGTTKYCSCFLRNLPCHKQECMYLHDVAKTEASFTKEDMQQGKHTEYERRLSDRVLNHVPEQRTHGRSVSPVRLSNKENYGEDMSAPSSSRSGRTHNNTAPRHRRALNRARSGSVERVSDCVSTGASASEDQSQSYTCTEQHHSCSSSVDNLSTQQSVPIMPAPGLPPPTTPPDTLHSSESWASQMTMGWPNNTESSLFGSQSRALSAVLAACAPGTQTHAHTHVNGYGTGLGAAGDGSALDTSAMFSELSASVAVARHQPEPAAVTDWQAAFGLKPLAEQHTKQMDDLAALIFAGGAVNTNCNTRVDTDAHVHGHAQAVMRADDTEDDLGFDPISESSKGLLDLIEQEKQAATWTNAAQARLTQNEGDRAAPSSLSNAPQSQLHKWRQPQTQAGNTWAQHNGLEHVPTGTGSGPMRPMHAHGHGHSPFTTPPPQFHSPNGAHVTDLASPFGPKFFGSPPNNGGNLMNGHMHDHNKGNLPPHFNGLRMPPMNRQNMPPRPPPPHNMHPHHAHAHAPMPQTLRAPPPHMPMPPPPPAQHTPHGSISPGPHQGRHSEAMVGSLSEWQEGLKSLLPNVNIHFAPGLQAPPHCAANNPHSHSNQPPPSAPNAHAMWRGSSSGMGMPGHGPGAGQPQFMQAPPPLQMPPNNMHSMPMRPSPPGRSPPEHPPFGAPQPPFNRPMHPHMFPPQPNGPWSSVTPPPPPPPGFSPGSAGNHRPL